MDIDPEALNNPTLGVAQIRPETTGREIEEAGLLFNPISSGNSGVPSLTRGEAVAYTGRADTISRLLDTSWAIEYVAANMEFATIAHQVDVKNPDYNGYWLSASHPGELADWEKMTAWHARGHFNIDEPAPNDIGPYLDRTWVDMEAFKKLDMLGIESLLANRRSRLR